MATVTTGVAMPSLSPLSTFRTRRTRSGRVGHHRRAERGVRGCERSAHQQRDPDAHAGEQRRRQQRPGGDGERQPHREQAGVETQVGAQVWQPNPGRIGEQNPDQGDLGDDLDGLVRELRLDDVGHLGEDEPYGDEHDRRAEVGTSEPRREKPPGENKQGDQRDGHRIHFASLPTGPDLARATSRRAVACTDPGSSGPPRHALWIIRRE